MMSVLCMKCEAEKATLDYSDCDESFGVESAQLCVKCANEVHQALPAEHRNIKSIALEDEDSEKTDKLDNISSQWLATESSCVEGKIRDIQANCHILKEQIKAAIDDFKTLLDTRQMNLLSNIDLARDRKVKLLSQHLDQLRVKAGCGEPSPPPLPALRGNTSCGFVPPIATLHHLSACLLMDYSEEVVEGDSVSVTAIGSIDQNGCFTVRILPDRDGLQDIMLQNISNSLEIDHTLAPRSLPVPFLPGQLCSARYAVDQRWYRAKVIEPSVSRGKTKVYFMDHGNTEDVPPSSIAPLDDKYQVFPFQMLQCCFSTDPKYSYVQREVRWKFNDLTHGRSLTATIVQQLPDNVRGKVYLVQLWDETSSQRQDVGASVMAVVEAMSRSQQKDSIKYRDVRYKDQPFPPNAKQVIVPTSSSSSSSSAADTGPHQSLLGPPPISSQPASAQSSSAPALADQSKPASLKQSESSKLTSASETKGSSSSSPAHPLSSLNSQELSPPPPPPPTQTDETKPPSKPSPSTHTSAPSQASQSSSPPAHPSHLPLTSKSNSTIDSLATTSNPQLSEDEVSSKGSEVGVATKEEFAVKSHASSVAVDETKSSLAAADKGTAKRDFNSSDEEVLRLMNPAVVAGAELDAFVTTSLSRDGSFWAQLSLDDPVYDNLAEKLKEMLSESRDVMTPVFFNVGDLCASMYSEDGSWYRARVMAVTDSLFTVRYLDFGNSEDRQAGHLAPLKSEFRQTPFQAVQCSIVNEEHTTFTQPEIDQFNKLVPIEDPVTINIIKVEGSTASVELILKVKGRSVDLTEEVYSADVTHFQSMDFGPSAKKLSSNSLPPLTTAAALPLTNSSGNVKCGDKIKVALESLPSPIPLPVSDSMTHPSNWADEMDAIQSPKDDGFLTLPGQESKSASDRSKSPSPAPAPAPTTETEWKRPPQQHESSLTDSATSRELSSSREKRKERESSRSISPRPVPAVRHSHDDRDARGPISSSSRTGSGVASSRSAPRLNLGAATKQILSGIGHGTARSGREGRRREKGDSPSSAEKVTGNHHQPEQNRVPNSGDHWGSRSPSPRRFTGSTSSQGSHLSDKHSSPTTARRRSPEPDVVQLFVKNIPSTMSPTEVSRMFTTYGKVHKFVQDPSRKQVVYIHMSSENALKAINGLHGKAIAKNCHPLVVERSNEKRTRT